MRDLGMVRWGQMLSADEQEELVLAIRALSDDDGPSLDMTCMQLAQKMEEARWKPQRCLVMCAVLWGIGRLERIVNLVDECKRNLKGGHLLSSLVVLGAAAEIKSGLAQDQKRVRAIVEEVWQLFLSSHDPESPGLKLGVGYVLYHAWRQKAISLGAYSLRKHETVSEEMAEWARRSFEVGEAAWKSLSTSADELARVFALNHCTYVAVVTGARAESIETFLSMLIPNVGRKPWNHRFDDTVACYHLWQFERAFASWKDRQTNRSPRLVQRMHEHLGTAREFFERAHLHDLGDIDTLQHQQWLQEAEAAFDLVEAGEFDLKS